jgi:hypothetical protein
MSLMKKAGSGAGFGSGSESWFVSQWYGSADPNPDQDVQTIMKMKLKLFFSFLLFGPFLPSGSGCDPNKSISCRVSDPLHCPVSSSLPIGSGGGVDESSCQKISDQWSQISNTWWGAGSGSGSAFTGKARSGSALKWKWYGSATLMSMVPYGIPLSSYR